MTQSVKRDQHLVAAVAAIPVVGALCFMWGVSISGYLSYWFSQTVWVTAGTILFVILCYFAIGLLVRSYRSVEGRKSFHIGLALLAVVSALGAWAVMALLTGNLLIGDWLQRTIVSMEVPGSSTLAGNLFKTGGAIGVVLAGCVLALILVLTYSYNILQRMSLWLFGEPSSRRPPRPPRVKADRPSRATSSKQREPSYEFGGTEAIDSMFDR